MNKVVSGVAWEEFCEALKEAGNEILANSAEDELERAEGFRYLARLTANNLHSSMEPAPLFPPELHYQTTRIGANNPDFLYGSVRVCSDVTYRIRGRLNDAFNFNIGAFHGQLGTAQGLQVSGFIALSDLPRDADGRFELTASITKQGAHWLAMCAETNQLLVRQTILKPGVDTPAEISIDVVDGDQTLPLQVLSAEQFEQRLGVSALMIHGIVKQFLGWTNDFKANPNQIRLIKPELLGMAKGDPNTQYNYAYFDLREGEALQIELRPPECEYWNIQLANHWMESFDNTSIASSINHANAQADGDGKVSVLVSLNDPKLPNWLNTQGHARGTIALRWVGADAMQPDPVCTLVRL